MKTHSTISRKLTIGLCTIILTAFVMSCTAPDNYNVLSVAKLKECKLVVINSNLLTKNWVYIDRAPNTPDKLALKKLHNEDFPKLQAELLETSKKWDDANRKELESIFTFITDTLFAYQKDIMKALNSMADYDDLFIVLEVQSMVEGGGEKCPDRAELAAANSATARIDKLLERIDKQTK